MSDRKTLPGYRLALFATALAVVVVLLGAYTRLTHAGLGCPDWPGCYGFIGVPMSEHKQAVAEARFPEAPVEVEKGWNEMVHRYFAGSLGLVILGLAGAGPASSRPGRPATEAAAAAARRGDRPGCLRHVDGDPAALAAGGHRAPARRLRHPVAAVPPVPAPVRCVAGRCRRCRGGCGRWRAWPCLLAVGQIALGGWVSSNYAAVACVDLPTCHGEWWPAMDFANGFHLTQHIGPNYLGGQLDSDARTAIHMTHRLGALVLSLVLLLLAWRLRVAGLGRLAGLLLLALAVQVSLGVSNVLLHLPLAVAVAHNAGGAALLLVLVLINYRLRAHPLAAHSREPADLAATRFAPLGK